MREGLLTDQLERVQLGLAVVTVGCAAAMVVGGLAFKSTRSAGSSGWADGVKPWVGWAVLGGLAILAMLAVGWWTYQWLVPAVGAVLLFLRAETAATAYRDRLETSFENHSLYTEQNLAMGLWLVPAVAIVGAVCAGLLIVISAWSQFGRGRERWFASAQR